MESGWKEFSRVLEEKIQERVLPLEQQLSQQQEIIAKLSESLQAMLEALQNKNSVKGEKAQRPGSAKAVPEKNTHQEPEKDHEEEKLDEHEKNDSESNGVAP
jgi:uncharacterized coiled-coil protein SlyX